MHDGHAWSAGGAIATGDAAQLYESLRAALPVDSAIASNVAGARVRSEIEEMAARAQIPLAVIRAEREQAGVTSAYRDPHQLGSDRWAALIAAHRKAPGHKLVVNAGTALTIDALAADGRFLGGLIVPGPALMRRSLDNGTAGLRLTEGAFDALPASTPDAITTGAIQACAGAVARTAEAMAARGCPPRLIILSGGAAAELTASLPYETILHENLVLDGLILIARNS